MRSCRVGPRRCQSSRQHRGSVPVHPVFGATRLIHATQRLSECFGVPVGNGNELCRGIVQIPSVGQRQPESTRGQAIGLAPVSSKRVSPSPQPGIRSHPRDQTTAVGGSAGPKVPSNGLLSATRQLALFPTR